MAVFNSQIGSLEDDSDISIINPSMNDEYVDNTYVPIITRLKQANHSSENRQTTNSQMHNNNNNNNHACPSIVGKDDYIFVDHDPECAKHLEQVLILYIRDLKQESNTQLDCDKQLVTRLMDLIRPAYSNNQQKMIQLDKIVQDIGVLHDRRHIDQEEKIQQYRADINRLNRMIFTASNDQTIHNNNTKDSMFSTLQQGYSSTDYEQWTEIEDDAKKLHELVQLQRNQINEIVSLISQTAASAIIEPSNVPTDNTRDATTDKPPTPKQYTTMINLFERIQDIIRSSSQPQPPVTNAPLPNITLINHSPGTSPTQSLSTLTSSLMATTIIDPNTEPIEEPETPVVKKEPVAETPVVKKEPVAETPVVKKEPVVEKPVEKKEPVVEKPVEKKEPVVEKPVDKKEPVVEKPHAPIDIPVSPPTPISPIEAKKCPVCNHEFPSTSDDVEMYDHIEKCLFPTGAAVEPKDYECPKCNRKFPGTDDSPYLQHLSDCYNRDF